AVLEPSARIPVVGEHGDHHRRAGPGATVQHHEPHLPTGLGGADLLGPHDDRLVLTRAICPSWLECTRLQRVEVLDYLPRIGARLASCVVVSAKRKQVPKTATPDAAVTIDLDARRDEGTSLLVDHVTEVAILRVAEPESQLGAL